jgi:hypothetical protein
MDMPVNGDTESVPDSRVSGLESHAEAVSRIGARMVVLCKFVDVVLPQLTAAQCRQIDRLFRRGVEDAMSCTDDIAVSGTYHATLLEQTNILLTVLGQKSAM